MARPRLRLSPIGVCSTRGNPAVRCGIGPDCSERGAGNANRYYDANDLGDVERWLDVTRPMSHVRGFMYTPWQEKYDLLPAFGDLLRQAR